MVKQQVEIVIFAVHHDAFLPFEKGEARAEFEDERLNLAQDGCLQILLRVSVLQSQKIQDVRIAEHEIGGDDLWRPVSFQR